MIRCDEQPIDAVAWRPLIPPHGCLRVCLPRLPRRYLHRPVQGEYGPRERHSPNRIANYAFGAREPGSAALWLASGWEGGSESIPRCSGTTPGGVLGRGTAAT